ncbi:hypothetical protein ig2599ANME_0776 [groundwater metagenome]
MEIEEPRQLILAGRQIGSSVPLKSHGAGKLAPCQIGDERFNQFKSEYISSNCLHQYHVRNPQHPDGDSQEDYREH